MARRSMDRPAPQYSRLDPISLTLALAMFSSYFEILRGHRTDFWCGWTWPYVAGVGAGFAFYWFVIFVATVLSWAVLARIGRGRISFAVGFPLCGLLSAAAVWAVLLPCWPGVRASMVSLLGAALLGFTILLLVVTRLGRLSMISYCAVMTVAFAAGMSAAIAAANLCLFEPELRRRALLGASVLWLGLAVGINLAAWAVSRAGVRKAVIRTSAGLFVVVSPVMAAWIVPQMRVAAFEKSGPNLLLITCDALRSDYCSAYGGHVPMPTLEGLAGQGVLFRRAYAPAPWTLPAMNAIFSSDYATSLTPSATRNQWISEMKYYQIEPKRSLLAERLAARGYATCAVAGNRLLRQPTGILRGFQHAAVFVSMRPERRSPFYQFPFLQDALRASCPALVEERPVDTTRLLTRLARVFLRQHRNTSFFLWIHYMDPHTPADPPERYRPADGPWPLFAPADPWWGTPQLESRTHRLDLPEEQQRFAQALYEGEMRYVDEHVGIVLGEIAAHDRLAETYVCVSADHGEEFWDHGHCFHGHSLYEELVRVPLIIAGPDLPKREIAEPVSLIDLMPTLADMTNVKPGDRWRGVSVAPQLRSGDAIRPSAVFAQGTYIAAPEPMQMVVAGEHKLVLNTQSARFELYDVVRDSRERTNLADEDPEQAAALKTLIEAWAASFPSTFETLLNTDDAPKPSEEVVKELGAMGYLD